MKNGTSQAVLVTDLLRLEGPFIAVADDFVLDRCSACRGPAGDDVQFLLAGFVCHECAPLFHG
jgi:hypothetical protein